MPQLVNVYTYTSEFTQIAIGLALLISIYSAVILPACGSSESTAFSLQG